MAFQVETSRILTGGINLLPPQDDIGETEVLAARNFRADQQGLLRSRRRETLLYGPFTPPVTTLWLRQSTMGSQLFTGDLNSLYADGALAKAGFDGARIGLASWQQNVWVMNRNQQGRLDAAGVWRTWEPVPPPAPTVAADATPGALNGSYDYYITYQTAEGFESDLSPFASITLASQQTDVTFACSADPTVTARNIYRGGGSQAQLLRVAQIDDNTTTTFTDNMTDVAAEELGITHTADHDPPPAARGLIGPYFDRLIAYNSNAYPNRFWWTEINKPSYFPGSGAAAGNWAPCGDDGEQLIRVTQKPRILIFYKERSIWRCIGDPGDDSSILEQLAVSVGAIGENAIAEVGAVDYFQAFDGIYQCNGDQVTKISVKLDPLFLHDAIEGAYAEPIDSLALDPAVRALNTLCHRNGNLYFSYQTDLAVWHTLVYNIALEQWTSDDRGFTCLFNEGQPFSLVGAIAGTPNVYEVDAADTGAMAVNLVTRFMDQGSPDVTKAYADLAIVHDTQGDVLTVNAITDFGNVTELGTISSNGEGITTLPFPAPAGFEAFEAKRIAIQVTGTVHQVARIFRADLHFRIEQREAITFDTGATDLGSPEVKELSAFACDLHNPSAAVSWTLYSDLPGGDLAVVASGSIPTALRRVAQVGIDLGLGSDQLPVGQLYRLVLSSTSAFRLYGLKLLVRALGQYVAPGQTLDTGGIDLGVSHVKELSAFACDLHNPSAAVSWTLYADLPNGDLQVVQYGSIPADTRRVNQSPLDIAADQLPEGRLFRFVMSSTAAFRLYDLRFLMRRLGVYLCPGQGLHTRELSCNSSRVKLFKKLEIDMRPDGPPTVKFSTDLPVAPGTVSPPMVARATVETVVATRQWNEIRLPSNTRGRFFRLDIDPAYNTRVYAARVLFKLIGEAGESAWDWFPIPLEPSEEVFAWTPAPIARTGETFSWASLPVDAS